MHSVYFFLYNEGPQPSLLSMFCTYYYHVNPFLNGADPSTRKKKEACNHAGTVNAQMHFSGAF